MQPRFPIYIPSKGRAHHAATAQVLRDLGVPYRLVIEAPEREDYLRAGHDPVTLLDLDPAYQRGYETCDNLGSSKSKGPGPARNFIWDHAVSEGAEWHWVMDDNILAFFHYNHNRTIRAGDGTPIAAMEDFTLRYENVAMAGPNYYMFVARKAKYPPFTTNTRIYSCNLIRNDIPFRWRGRYNEDTDLSLRILKAGWCTIQFNAYLQWKTPTQRTPGGNTEEFYSKEGTRAKSLMLARLHPDVARVTHRFGRTHHHVDYRPFKANALRRRPDVEIQDADPYRPVLVERSEVQDDDEPSEGQRLSP